jgi:hypothetical protein
MVEVFRKSRRDAAGEFVGVGSVIVAFLRNGDRSVLIERY